MDIVISVIIFPILSCKSIFIHGLIVEYMYISHVKSCCELFWPYSSPAVLGRMLTISIWFRF